MRVLLTVLPLLLLVSPEAAAKKLHITVKQAPRYNLSRKVKITKVRGQTGNPIKIKVKKVTTRSTRVPVRHQSHGSPQQQQPVKVNHTLHRVRSVPVHAGVPGGQSSIHMLRSALEHGTPDTTTTRNHEVVRPRRQVRTRPRPRSNRASRRKIPIRVAKSTAPDPQPSQWQRLQYQLDLLQMSEALQ